VSWPELRRSIPNALTVARFAAIPIFAWLYLKAGDGAAWGAGVFFAAAALTDQLDGYLARRWHVESRFGTIADPLADRLMIGTAAVLMLTTGRIPLLAAIVILGRDVALVLGYRVLSRADTSSRSHSSGRPRPGSSMPRSASSSSRRRERPGRSRSCGSASLCRWQQASSTRCAPAAPAFGEDSRVEREPSEG
jgi:phosphatidylglycerophosphate synthase